MVMPRKYTEVQRKEIKRQYMRKYRREHPDRTRKTWLNWYKKNKERAKEYWRKYSEENKKLRSEGHKKWRNSNKEKYYAFINSPEQKLKLAARRRDRKKKDSKCSSCATTSRLEFHHTDYLKGDGLTLCRPCHNREHRINGDVKLNVT